MPLGGQRLIEVVGCRHPIVQAPMAGATTPALAAAVSEAGGLGSLGGAILAPGALREQIRETRRLTEAPFNVNLFAPLEPAEAPERVEAMRASLEPWRGRLGLPESEAPGRWSTPFDDQIEVVLEERPPVFSFTFGIPPADRLSALREAGIVVLGTATTVREAVALESAGCDVVVAQGSEAGGHRGSFATPFESALVGLVALVPQIVDRIEPPVVAAGGIMDGRGIAAALALGASGAQLGTAFLGCDESATPESHRRSLAEADDEATVVTDAFTGRPARGLRTPFFDALERGGPEIPPYPLHQALIVELRQAALERDQLDLVIRLAGQGVGMIRRGPAAELLQRLVAETEETLGRLSD
jgi:nitronate monooxygenase